MKILYLCPEIPYPADSGGKVAFQNHIEMITKNNHVDAFFLDADGTGYTIPSTVKAKFNNYKVYSRDIPRATGMMGKLTAFYHFLISPFPRAYSVRSSRELTKDLEDCIGDYDVVVFDHFSTFAFVNDHIFKKKISKSIYISHNLEAGVIQDQFRLENNVLKKLYHYIEYLKTKAAETKILKTVDQVVTISTGDFDVLNKLYPDKSIVNIPEILPLADRSWSAGAKQTITFLGGSKYFPNYEAIDWLVKVLHPELKNSAIDIAIIGSVANYLDDNPEARKLNNLNFYGYVADEHLDQHLLNSSIFISPILYGAGIKIKVLKAISLGIPIFCTNESLFGIEYLKTIPELIFDRADLATTVTDLKNIIGDTTKLQEISTEILERSGKQEVVINAKWAQLLT